MGGRKSELARSIFRGLSVSYDSVLDWMTLQQDRRWKNKLLDGMPLPRGARVLDIGCGTCVLEESPFLGGAQAIGIDITSEMLRIGQRKDLASVSMLGLADAEHLPFKDATFDLVVSCYVPKYCNPTAFVEEMARVLRPGGGMAVYDFTAPHGLFSPFIDFYVYGFVPIFGRLISPIDTSLGFTCSVLPDLIRSTTWKEELGRALLRSSFSRVGREAATGGVVTIFRAFKSPDLPS